MKFNLNEALEKRYFEESSQEEQNRVELTETTMSSPLKVSYGLAPKYTNENEESVIKAKEIADKQFTAAGTTGYSSSNEICFDLFGIAISNPFVTPDTTMELSLEEAYAYYGIANMNWFIDKCNEA